MEVFYTNNDELHPVGLLEKNKLYAVQVDTLWVRVELIEYIDDGNVSNSIYMHLWFMLIF